MAGQTSTNKEDYMVAVTGLPLHWNWQDFKDDVRKYVVHQPGWADIWPTTRPVGGKEGWCRFALKDDGERAYSHYASLRSRVNVHLFATSQKGDTAYNLLRCNCDVRFQGVAPGCHSPIRSGIDVHTVSQTLFRQQQTILPQMAVPAPMTYTYQPYPVATAYSYAYAAPMPVAAAPMSVYAAASNGMPVNVGGGAVYTEARGIFISNLSYSVGTSELRNLLASVGRPIQQTLQRDSRTGKSKGSATALFQTKEEAQYAVARLHNHKHMGMTLKVRLDTEATIVGQGPVIVDGSSSSRVV